MSNLSILHGCATIQLTKGMNALIDVADYPWVSRLKWTTSDAGSRFYAARHTKSNRKTTRFYMHREVISAGGIEIPPKHDVDHKNRDSLDNRRENLRVATKGQNRSNSCKKTWRGGKSSQYKGVSLLKHSGRWRALIVKDKKTHVIGYFGAEIDAALAYNRAALEIHGDFARINEGI